MDSQFIEMNEISGVWTFLKSIEWQDPWLICLIVFHVIITLMALLTKNYGNFQIVLFLVLLVMVYFSENINEIASLNWKKFSRQQYFDSKGLFISIVFSVPILLNCMLMVGQWLYQSTQLMTKLKRAQLREKLKQQNNIKQD
ncbi:transmembrane protein 18 [Chrysoperla carnea]|uniref:transmembrane protein 18 n=1 Tax=Chrysoperla carnea TaxID=189513 RepID=UPI001D06A64E|nr:transmembrane protein 18 [Chrysoperla carnea]